MKRTVASLKTSALSVGIGAMFSLGVHCVFSFLSCYFDSNPGKHPIRYPASIGIGMICLMIFLVLVYLYAKVRKKEHVYPWNRVGCCISHDILYSVLLSVGHC